MHNICCDNCHSHVARVLNNLNYKGRSNYTMVDVWWMCLAHGKYVSVSHILNNFALFTFILVIYAIVQICKLF